MKNKTMIIAALIVGFLGTSINAGDSLFTILEKDSTGLHLRPTCECSWREIRIDTSKKEITFADAGCGFLDYTYSKKWRKGDSTFFQFRLDKGKKKTTAKYFLEDPKRGVFRFRVPGLPDYDGVAAVKGFDTTIFKREKAVCEP